ncbi:MAG: hypothetical protein ACI4OR_00130 [Alphaproteobacteria bacterium]
MKKIFSVFLAMMILGMAFRAKAFQAHEPFFSGAVFDIGGSLQRAISVIIKFFLSDDNELVAELVYDGEGGGSCGGNGGAYTGDNGSASAPLNAVASSITDIPAEANAYPADIQIQQTSVAELAKYRIQSVVQEQASLNQLSADRWAIQYRAQQRAIQAMTDALVMKKAYQELAAVGEKAASGSYSNYSEAVSTVATRRLLLDALMALRKRVIAARVRARAETMEMNLEDVATAPSLEGDGTTDPSATENTQNTTTGAETNEIPSDYDNSGLGEGTAENAGNSVNESAQEAPTDTPANNEGEE